MGQFDRLVECHLQQYAADAYVFTSIRGNVYSIRLIRHWQEDAISVYLNTDIEVYEIHLEIIERKDRSCDKGTFYNIMKKILGFFECDSRVVFVDINRGDGRDKEYLCVYRTWLKIFQRGTKNQTVMLHRVLERPGHEDSHVGSLMPNKTSKLFPNMSCDDMMDSVLRKVFPSSRI